MNRLYAIFHNHSHKRYISVKYQAQYSNLSLKETGGFQNSLLEEAWKALEEVLEPASNTVMRFFKIILCHWILFHDLVVTYFSNLDLWLKPSKHMNFFGGITIYCNIHELSCAIQSILDLCVCVSVSVVFCLVVLWYFNWIYCWWLTGSGIRRTGEPVQRTATTATTNGRLAICVGLAYRFTNGYGLRSNDVAQFARGKGRCKVNNDRPSLAQMSLLRLASSPSTLFGPYRGISTLFFSDLNL